MWVLFLLWIKQQQREAEVKIGGAVPSFPYTYSWFGIYWIEQKGNIILPLKRRQMSTRLHGVVSHKTVYFVVTNGNVC
jgi:hypothetical protein